MPPSLVWELGSKKASSTRELVLRHCVHNKRCNVLRYLYCGYGVSSPLCRNIRGEAVGTSCFASPAKGVRKDKFIEKVTGRWLGCTHRQRDR